MAQWITFKEPVKIPGYNGDRTGMCVEGPKGIEIAKTMGEIVSISSLPYPADPRLKTDEDSCPSFCFNPRTCQGYTSCPRSYACSE